MTLPNDILAKIYYKGRRVREAYTIHAKTRRTGKIVDIVSAKDGGALVVVVEWRDGTQEWYGVTNMLLRQLVPYRGFEDAMESILGED